MKILGTLFRFLCALIVLLAVAVYLDGSLQATLTEYLEAFTPAHLRTFAVPNGWFAIAAGALLLITLCCGMKLGWNLFYSLSTIAFFTGVAIMVLGPEVALPSPARGLGWEPMLRELPLNYPVPSLMVPAFCILGCLCSTAPVRIAWTSLYSCALCYGCAELLALAVQYWQSMPEPFMAHALSMIKLFPWILLALPAVFFLQYCLFMALFETFMPRGKKSAKNGKETEGKKEADAKDEVKKEEEAAPASTEAKLPATAATVNVTPKSVVVKRPVVHKKKPISPAPSEVEEEAQPEEKPADKAEEKTETKPEEVKAAEAKPEEKAEEKPAESKREEKSEAKEEKAAEEDEKPATPAAE